MNSHECTELARNEHPGIMKRGDTRFRPSKEDCDQSIIRELEEVINMAYDNARNPGKREGLAIARTLDGIRASFIIRR